MHNYLISFNPVSGHFSMYSPYLELADFLTKGFPYMQIGNGVVQDSLHDPAGKKRDTMGV